MNRYTLIFSLLFSMLSSYAMESFSLAKLFSEKYPTNQLVQAIVKEDLKTVTRLIENGADVNSEAGPLVFAVRVKNEKICRLLLEHHADPNQQESGELPLSGAIRFNLPHIYRLLSDYGANCQESDSFMNKRTTHDILAFAVRTEKVHLIPTMVTESNIHPYLPADQFQKFLAARQRMIMALCVMKKLCPALPGDIKKMIFQGKYGLKADLKHAYAFGNLKNISPVDAHRYPLSIVSYLIQKKYLEYEGVIWAIQNATLYYFKHCAVAIPSVDPLVAWVLLDRNEAEKRYGEAIEQTIKRRLAALGTKEAKSCAIQ